MLYIQQRSLKLFERTQERIFEYIQWIRPQLNPPIIVASVVIVVAVFLSTQAFLKG